MFSSCLCFVPVAILFLSTADFCLQIKNKNMASVEQIDLANKIKNVHKSLRAMCRECGDEQAWKRHMNDEETRKIYAESMKQLASDYWNKNDETQDRIKWTIDYCEKYFSEEIVKWYEKDLRSIEFLKSEGKVSTSFEATECQEIQLRGSKIEVLDVGSSGNFFRNSENFKILPIDISPSDPTVYVCDFLSVNFGDSLEMKSRQQNVVDFESEEIIQLPRNHFHVVVFCLLLEYLPSSELRIKCCQRAYEVLKSQGILVIITPDSNHENRNSKLIKHWRWTLEHFGFHRIKLTKLRNLTCMAFRKSLHPEICMKWAETHKESYMTKLKIEIPQDSSKV